MSPERRIVAPTSFVTKRLTGCAHRLPRQPATAHHVARRVRRLAQKLFGTKRSVAWRRLPELGHAAIRQTRRRNWFGNRSGAFSKKTRYCDPDKRCSV